MRAIELNRTTAEELVELLESCDPKQEGTWRHDLADEVRRTFGMISKAEEPDKKFYNQPLDFQEAELHLKSWHCIACDSRLLVPVQRPGMPIWFAHCNHCGMEIPIVVLVNKKAWQATRNETTI